MGAGPGSVQGSTDPGDRNRKPHTVPLQTPVRVSEWRQLTARGLGAADRSSKRGDGAVSCAAPAQSSRGGVYALSCRGAHATLPPGVMMPRKALRPDCRAVESSEGLDGGALPRHTACARLPDLGHPSGHAGERLPAAASPAEHGRLYISCRAKRRHFPRPQCSQARQIQNSKAAHRQSGQGRALCSLLH